MSFVKCGKIQWSINGPVLLEKRGLCLPYHSKPGLLEEFGCSGSKEENKRTKKWQNISQKESPTFKCVLEVFK
eukprot:g59402.t1